MKWYQEAIGYEIYPYSFKDSNRDGYGDLRGVIEKLDYLKTLGITLIWLCPVFQSPREDYGYDVSDFYTIEPVLGTNEDFRELIEKAHEKGIRVIMDLVMNHVSSEHEWFKAAVGDPKSPYHDYFIFKKPVMKNGVPCVPNNWEGFFGGSVWTYVPALDEYYLHIFSDGMPDLNWECEALRQEMYRVARHYLDLGVDGFRMDAIAHLAKEPTFSDSLKSSGPVLDTDMFSNRDRLFDYLAEFRKEVTDRYPDVLTVGEVGGEVGTDGAIRYADRRTGSLTMVFNFDTCWENGAFGSLEKADDEIRTNVVNLKRLLKKWYDACHERCEMPLYWLNHDHPRVVSQYGSPKYREKSAKMLATVLLFLYGTPFLYQGEELGMTNADYMRPEDFYEDVDARRFAESHPDVPEDVLLRFFRRCSRINARTPMQWTPGPYAGFSEHEPYLHVNGNYPYVNAEEEINDPQSVFHYYRKAIALRKELNGLIRNGTLRFEYPADEDLLVAVHEDDEQELTLIANFRDTVRSLEVPAESEVILGVSDAKMHGGKLTVGPYDAFLLKKLKKLLKNCEQKL